MIPVTRSFRCQLPRLLLGARVAAGLLLMLVLIPEVGAVFTFSPLVTTPRRITLQVGSSSGIDQVTFDVNNAVISPSPVAVAANGAATLVKLTAEIRLSSTQVKLSVDSSAALACVSGSGCGSTLIPFSTISWVSGNHDTVYPGFDIQDGTFNGSASQLLTNYYVSGGSITMSNTLSFTYANTTVYPAGRYEGRVTFTASMP